MAKICFYCGKELQPGVRCSCRGSGKPAGGASSGAGSSSSSQTSSSYSQTASSSSSAASSSAFSQKEEKPKKQKEKKGKQVWRRATSGSADSAYGNEWTKQKDDTRFSFSRFIDQVRARFPSLSKILRPVMSYIWHPVTTIQNRARVVPIGKTLLIHSLFAALTSLMVLFTNSTVSPFLGMLIDLMFGKTDLFTEHPLIAFFTISAILWFCVLLLASCFFITSRFANRKLKFLRALDTVTMSSIYMCFADVLIFLSVLLGTRGSFTLIFVALIIMSITHFVSLKNDLGLSENATFNMLAVSYLLFYTLAKLGTGIIIRVATLF